MKTIYNTNTKNNALLFVNDEKGWPCYISNPFQDIWIKKINKGLFEKGISL